MKDYNITLSGYVSAKANVTVSAENMDDAIGLALELADKNLEFSDDNPVAWKLANQVTDFEVDEVESPQLDEEIQLH